MRIFSNDMSTKCLPVVQCPLYTTFETASGHQDTDTSEDEIHGQSSDKIQYRTKDNGNVNVISTSSNVLIKILVKMKYMVKVVIRYSIELKIMVMLM